MFARLRVKNFRISLVLLAVLAIGCTFPAFADLVSPHDLYHHAWQTVKDKYYDADLKGVDWNALEHKYDPQIGSIDDAHKYIKEMLEQLGDRGVKFIDPRELIEEKELDKPKIQGIGINLMRADEKDALRVTRVLDDSPAKVAGIKAGDEIIKVNDKDVAGKTPVDVSRLIRGEAASEVKITVKRDGVTKVIPVVRSEIVVKSVTSKVTDQNIGIIHLHSLKFASVPGQFREALESLRGTNYLIIDLQDNDGGSLANAVKIANMLLDKGTIATTDVRGFKQVDTAFGATLSTLPVLLLVNEETTGETEVLVAALKENGRAFVLGEKTGGRGLAYATIKLPDGSGIKLPYGRYFTPTGKEIHRVGITPDTHLEPGKGRANNLDAAMQYLKKKLDEKKTGGTGDVSTTPALAPPVKSE